MILAHLADIHFGREDAVAIERAHETVLSAGTSAVIMAGDLTQRGKRSEFAAAQTYLRSFNLPVLSVPGNHDTPLLDMQARAVNPFGRYQAYLGEFSAPIDAGGVAVQGLNTARGWQARSNWAEGSVNMDDLDAVVRHAALPGGAVRMLTCHHPFRPPSRTPLRVVTRRGIRASQKLGASEVCVLMTGHIHAPHAEIISEPQGSYLAISAGTLSSRLRSAPPSFNLISIDEDCLRLKIMELQDAKFVVANEQSWKLPDLKRSDALPGNGQA